MTLKKKKLKVKHLLYFLIAFIISTLIVDFVRISKYEIIPKRPVENIERQEHDKIQYELANGSDSVDWSGLDGTLEYIKGEYDCSDFRLVNTIRLLFEAKDKMPNEYKAKIEDVLLNFRWWWDEPGANSMCEHS